MVTVVVLLLKVAEPRFVPVETNPDVTVPKANRSGKPRLAPSGPLVHGADRDSEVGSNLPDADPSAPEGDITTGGFELCILHLHTLTVVPGPQACTVRD